MSLLIYSFHKHFLKKRAQDYRDLYSHHIFSCSVNSQRSENSKAVPSQSVQENSQEQEQRSVKRNTPNGWRRWDHGQKSSWNREAWRKYWKILYELKNTQDQSKVRAEVKSSMHENASLSNERKQAELCNTFNKQDRILTFSVQFNRPSPTAIR